MTRVPRPGRLVRFAEQIEADARRALLGPALADELGSIEASLAAFRNEVAGLGVLVTWSIEIAWRQGAGSKTEDPAGTSDPSARGKT